MDEQLAGSISIFRVIVELSNLKRLRRIYRFWEIARDNDNKTFDFISQRADTQTTRNAENGKFNAALRT